MTITDRLEHWKEQGAISPEQCAHLTRVVRREPFSLFPELNILLYAGVISFVGGLGWTVSTWSHQMGDVVVLAILSSLLIACGWYIVTRASAWSSAQTPASTTIFDYVLYLGSLVWCIELAYVEARFHLLSGQWDIYLLITAIFFFLLAYRFDNRFVLSLALSSLAGWFGLTISHWPSTQSGSYRYYAIAYCLVVGGGGALMKRLRVKSHFFGTYLNIAANVLFWAILSGVFEREESGLWVIALIVACGASVFWGVTRQEFAFVAYAAVYGYVGTSSLFIRGINDFTVILGYFVVTAIAMVAGLVVVARNFGSGRPK
jgi:hypothetical protein